MAGSAVMSVIYAFIFYRLIQDTPAGRPFRRPRKKGALEVSTRAGLFSLVIMQVPMVFCLAC